MYGEDGYLVITLQCIQRSNYYVVHLKLITYYVPILPQLKITDGKKNKSTLNVPMRLYSSWRPEGLLDLLVCFIFGGGRGLMGTILEVFIGIVTILFLFYVCLFFF